MKPWETIDKVRSEDGTELSLVRRGDEWVVRCDGKPLMSTRQHGSEEALARLGLAQVVKPKKVFVGGLGLGFTARAALDLMPLDSRLIVGEFTPAIIEWNRKYLGAFARYPLDDARVEVRAIDAVEHIYRSTRVYDAILLDIDNGPSAMVHQANDRLYSAAGISACYAALIPGGTLAVWSAGPDAAYLKRLNKGGFDASAPVAPSRGDQGGVHHVVFVARRPQ